MEEEYDSPNQGDYKPLSEVSAYTPYSQEYLSLLARKGKIEAQKIGEVWYARRDVVERYSAEHREDVVRFGKASRKSSESKNIYKSALKQSSFKPFAVGFCAAIVLVIVSQAGVVQAFADKHRSGYRQVQVMAQQSLGDLRVAATNLGGYYADAIADTRYLTAGIFDPFVSVFKSGGQAYQSTNKKITSFFGNAYLKVVETVVPGYTPEGSPLQGPSSQFAEELEET
ncbi:MAG: hypothetical protein WAP23_03555, partial [Candidatus Spechtbacterales bacterium]